MKSFLLAGVAALGVFSLSACMTGDIYGPPPGYADVDYGGYYDGYYGPFSGDIGGLVGCFTIWIRAPGASIPTKPAISAAMASPASIPFMDMRRLPQAAVIKAGPSKAVVLDRARTNDRLSRV